MTLRVECITLLTMEPNETAEDSYLDASYEDRTELAEQEPYDGGGWPGDFSGTDDFQDFNQMESADYGDE